MRKKKIILKSETEGVPPIYSGLKTRQYVFDPQPGNFQMPWVRPRKKKKRNRRKRIDEKAEGSN